MSAPEPTANSVRHYYTVLGVLSDSSHEDIREAYRRKAKELHPDVNHGKDTTARFQELQEAYSVLGSPERRALYDSGDEDAARSPNTKATEADFEPFPCDRCGEISAQPRHVRYHYVFSFVLGSIQRDMVGVFCSRCAGRKLFWSSVITGTIGWLGLPWGIIWSVRALFWNLLGGRLQADPNALVLTKQGQYFYAQGDKTLAAAVFADALEFTKRGKKSVVATQCAHEIQSLNLPVKRMRHARWTGVSVPRISAFLGLIVAGTIWWAFVIWQQGDATAEMLEAREKRVNASSGTMIDQITRLDGGTAGPGKRFTYRYTIMTFPIAQINRQVWNEQFVPEARKYVLNTSPSPLMLQRGVTICSQYFSSEGLLIDEIIVTPEDLKSGQ